jgi:hypothetical protein
MRYDNEALRAAVAGCRAAERALEEAQLHYRQAQEAAAFFEAERARAQTAAADAQCALLASREQQTASVAVLTAVLEDSCRPKRPPR